MATMVLVCPKCDSTDVRPINGTYMVHRCAKCGFTSDASKFGRGCNGESILLDDPLAEFFLFVEVED